MVGNDDPAPFLSSRQIINQFTQSCNTILPVLSFPGVIFVFRIAPFSPGGGGGHPLHS
jgi:hypothetical protein